MIFGVCCTHVVRLIYATFRCKLFYCIAAKICLAFKIGNKGSHALVGRLISMRAAKLPEQARQVWLQPSLVRFVLKRKVRRKPEGWHDKNKFYTKKNTESMNSWTTVDWGPPSLGPKNVKFHDHVCVGVHLVQTCKIFIMKLDR